MGVKPSYEEIRDFKKFLTEKGFEATALIDPDAFYKYLSYGYIFLRIEYTKKNEFKDISVMLCLDWDDNSYGKSKFPKTYDLGKPVKSLNREFVQSCIKAASDVMEEINAAIARLPALIDRALLIP
jgi:hypothetical protein